MAAIAKTFSAMEPMHCRLPESAADYYAIAKADLNRIESSVHTIDNALLTVDYSNPHQYKFSIALNDGTHYDQLPQQYQLEPVEPIAYVDETVGFIEDRFTVFNVCHFLFDKLARTVELSENTIDSYLLFKQHTYFDEVFSMLGFKQTKLERPDTGLITYKIKKLCVSTSSYRFRHPGFNFRPEVLSFLNDFKQKCLAIEIRQPKYKRIYVDRDTVGARNIANKELFYSLLAEFDFTPVCFEKYSLVEQARIVHNSEVMLGVHGAGLSNAMFFAYSEFKLLEILPPLCATSDYWKLANAFDIQYDAFIADDLHRARPHYPTWEHDASLNRRDISIDENAFRRFLELHT